MIDELVSGLFDYAGMFPPAALSFEETLANSATFPSTLRRPQLLANDIVLTPENLSRLDDAALAAAAYNGRPCNICLVGVPIELASSTAQAIQIRNEETSGMPVPQIVTAIEIHGDSVDVVDELRAARRASGGVQLYYELKVPDAQLATQAEEVIDMLHGLRSNGAAIGFKARCAGPTAVSHATLATIIAAVNRAKIPLKMTQGLHHPIAGDAAHGNEHGFLNVIAALRLQYAPGLDAETITKCLRETNHAAFDFSSGINYRSIFATPEQVGEAARAVPFAIGSCSLDEPDQELVNLFSVR